MFCLPFERFEAESELAVLVEVHDGEINLDGHTFFNNRLSRNFMVEAWVGA